MEIPLPEYYFEWLEKLDDAYCVEFNGRCCFISTLEEMRDEVTIDKMKSPAWQQLKSLCEMYVTSSNADVTTDQDGNEINIERLKNCAVIGDDNGDPLYIDPSLGNSVWVYYLDGGDVAQISSDLQVFISESTVVPE